MIVRKIIDPTTRRRSTIFVASLKALAVFSFLHSVLMLEAQAAPQAVDESKREDLSSFKGMETTGFSWETSTRALFGELPRTADTRPEPAPKIALDRPAVVSLNPAPVADAPANLEDSHQRIEKKSVRPSDDLDVSNSDQPTDTLVTNRPFAGWNELDLQQSSDFPTPWWTSMACEAMFTTVSEPITPDFLVYAAIENSPFVRVISSDTLIREQEVIEASAEFDPEIFARSLYDDRVDPVGNLLTTGGLPFLKDNIWNGTAGSRRKLQAGGELEISQRFGFQNSNSRFFTPQDQGTATLAISMNQPLLRGGGRYFNCGQILIAQANQQAAWENFLGSFQDELIKIGDAYWNLGYRRSILLQKQRNVQRGAAVLAKLQGRAELDSVPSQILRAQAAVSSRQTELSNALRDVENGQTDIRRLVGDGESISVVDVELIPTEAPAHDYDPQPLDQLVRTAVQSRPEIRESVQAAKVAAIECDLGRNEMLPELNLIFRTYVAGLQPDSAVGQAWQQQFVNSTPGYAAGLEYSVPYGRRAAQSRLTQRKILLRRVNEEVEITVLNVVSETQVAARRLDSAYRTMQAGYASIEACNADLEYQEQRWESFALVEGDLAEGQSPVSMLDQLLDAQQRLANAEAVYAQAEFEYKKAEIALQRATGVLMQYGQFEFNPASIDGTPALQIEPDGR